MQDEDVKRLDGRRGIRLLSSAVPLTGLAVLDPVRTPLVAPVAEDARARVSERRIMPVADRVIPWPASTGVCR